MLNTIPRPVLIRLSYIFRQFSKLLNKGDNVHCPVCDSSYKKFLPYGYDIVRPNALCPNCLSLERHRILWLFLRNKTDFFTTPQKVLHIAPEQSFLARFKKMDNLDYTTADLESPIVDVKCDVQNMPFDADQFDMVICNHVMEHVPSDIAAMKEIYRVLKKGGKAILLVPFEADRKVTFEDNNITDRNERTRIFGQYDHVRVYGTDYPERVKSVGFKIDAPNYIDELSNETKSYHALASEELMYAYVK